HAHVARVVADGEGDLVELGAFAYVPARQVEDPVARPGGEPQIGAVLRPPLEGSARVQVLRVEIGAVQARREDPVLVANFSFHPAHPRPADVDAHESGGVEVDQVALAALETGDAEAPAAGLVLETELPGLGALRLEVRVAEEGVEEIAERGSPERLAVAGSQARALGKSEDASRPQAGLGAEDVVVVPPQPHIEVHRSAAVARLAEGRPGPLPRAVDLDEGPRAVGHLQPLPVAAEGEPEVAAGAPGGDGPAAEGLGLGGRIDGAEGIVGVLEAVVEVGPRELAVELPRALLHAEGHRHLALLPGDPATQRRLAAGE